MTKNSVLLVKPDYYSRYPAVALMKFSSYFGGNGWKVKYVEGCESDVGFYPCEIYITSLYTYEWRRVHDACLYYRKRFPRANIKVGGVYASLMPDHLADLGVEVHTGQFAGLDGVPLDYSICPGWHQSLVSSSRGCIRSCGFGAVKRIEPKFECRPTIRDQVDGSHTRIILWDNNFLASPYRDEILSEIVAFGKEVDFCQGLDIRLVDDIFLRHVPHLKFRLLRFAYDVLGIKQTVAKHVMSLVEAGIRPREIFFYVLYNFRDSPDQFLAKAQDILDLGCVAYPMRYEPLNSLRRGRHVGENWDSRSLDMVNRLRRVLGSHGALPPYDKLRRKICGSPRFEVAFSLRPERRTRGMLAAPRSA